MLNVACLILKFKCLILSVKSSATRGCLRILWMLMDTADAEALEASKHRSYAAMPAPCGLGRCWCLNFKFVVAIPNSSVSENACNPASNNVHLQTRHY